MNNRNNSIRIKDLEVLIDNFTKWEEFNHEFAELTQKFSFLDIGEQLENIALGKKNPFINIITVNKIVNFYKKYQDIFNQIHRNHLKDYPTSESHYAGIDMFLKKHYNWQTNGQMKEDGSLAFYYNYLTSQKEQLPTIKELIAKITSLGITDITLDQNIDFTEKIHFISESETFKDKKRTDEKTPDTFYSTLTNREKEDIYLYESTVVQPTYKKGTIPYHASFSRYQIKLPSLLAVKRWGETPSITLKSLLLDPECLPNSLDRRREIRYLETQHFKNEKLNSDIQDSCRIDSLIRNLSDTTTSACQSIERVDDETTRNALEEGIKMAKRGLEILKQAATIHDERLLSKNPNYQAAALQGAQKTYSLTEN